MAFLNFKNTQMLTITKNNEKVLIWMHRNKRTINYIADLLGCTRQVASKKLKENNFSESEFKKLQNEFTKTI